MKREDDISNWLCIAFLQCPTQLLQLLHFQLWTNATTKYAHRHKCGATMLNAGDPHMVTGLQDIVAHSLYWSWQSSSHALAMRDSSVQIVELVCSAALSKSPRNHLHFPPGTLRGPAFLEVSHSQTVYLHIQRIAYHMCVWFSVWSIRVRESYNKMFARLEFLCETRFRKDIDSIYRVCQTTIKLIGMQKSRVAFGHMFT